MAHRIYGIGNPCIACWPHFLLLLPMQVDSFYNSKPHFHLFLHLYNSVYVAWYYQFTTNIFVTKEKVTIEITTNLRMFYKDFVFSQDYGESDYL